MTRDVIVAAETFSRLKASVSSLFGVPCLSESSIKMRKRDLNASSRSTISESDRS